MHEQKEIGDRVETVRPNMDEWLDFHVTPGSRLEFRGPLVGGRAHIAGRHVVDFLPIVAIIASCFLAYIRGPWFAYLLVSLIGLGPFVVDRTLNVTTIAGKEQSPSQSGAGSERSETPGKADRGERGG